MSDLGKILEIITPEFYAKLDEREVERQREDEERARVESARLRGRHERDARSKIPARSRKALEAATRTAALDAVADFAGGIMVLSGPPGCGKTVAAADWFVRRYTDCGAGEFVTAFQLERMGRYGDDIGTLSRVGCLVIDDLGNEYLDQKGNFVSLLDGLINERYSWERDTVIATNLDANEFKQSYGARIADRIREVGRFVSINEPSLRRKE